MRHVARHVGPVVAAVLAGLACSSASQAQGVPRTQGVMSQERCKTLMTIISGITFEYHDQISSDFISDLQRKVGPDGKCDGPDEYRVWPNMKDREALGRIRQLLTAWDICQKEPGREGCKSEDESNK